MNKAFTLSNPQVSTIKLYTIQAPQTNGPAEPVSRTSDLCLGVDQNLRVPIQTAAVAAGVRTAKTPSHRAKADSDKISFTAGF
jgi:hypothetical protein